MSNQVGWFIPDVFMGNGHAGLARIAYKEGVDAETLDPGQFVIYINRSYTAFKLLGANNIIIHYKSPSGDLSEATNLIPQFLENKNVQPVVGYAIAQIIEDHYYED